ncbi:MAG: 8-amino-7-oxononanoate synthase [Rhodanobacteraceae bacterium]|nr:8-amino-7-oxononanoate synthase [Rhodanobacteraceae bacterium]
MSSLATRARARVAERDAAGLRRVVREVERADGVHLRIDGRALISFASNDYLGLAQHPDVVRAMQEAANRWGVGSTAAHLLGGHRGPHAQLEREVAQWLGYESALLFSTGYLANLGVIAGLMQRGDVCVQDKLNHACLIDGAQLAGCTLRRYPHNDVDAAARQLDRAGDAPALLATDGVFSMDGDLAPLSELAARARERDALLFVDDAHGFGVLGADGQGSPEHLGLGAREVPLRMVTLGKAVGCGGALVLGSQVLIDALIQFARPFVYTTALSPAIAAAASTAIAIIRREPERRAHLRDLIARFRSGATQLGYTLMDSVTPIQPLLIGDTEAALALSDALMSRGWYVPAIRPPTVPAGSARLRVTLSAAHTAAQIDGLLAALNDARQS